MDVVRVAAGWLAVNGNAIRAAGSIATALGVIVAARAFGFNVAAERRRYRAHVTAVVSRVGVQVGMPAAVVRISVGSEPPPTVAPEPPPMPFTNVSKPAVLVRNMSHRPTAILAASVVASDGTPIDSNKWRTTVKTWISLAPWSIAEFELEVEASAGSEYRVLLSDMDGKIIQTEPVTPLTGWKYLR